MSAKDKVKIERFLDEGIKLRGVIHVGTNNGYEIQFYREMGLEVLGFEPLKTAFNECWAKYGDDPHVGLSSFALGDECRVKNMLVPEGDGQGSTFLEPLDREIAFGSYKLLEPQRAYIIRFDILAEDFDLDPYNCLVVDVQGMELQVLNGFGKYLDRFDCLNIECSREPVFEGEAPAVEVCAFLLSRGFTQLTEICDHDDILFVRSK